jgi:hypothetical protein
MKMVQEMDMQMTMEGLPPNMAAGLGAGPMNISTKATTIMTQKVGAADSQGNVEVETTIDESRTDSTMNGRPMAAAAPTSALVGKTFTVVFDQRGKIISTKIPPAAGLPENVMKQMVESLYEKTPTDLVGVGETATAPLKFTIPLPLPGAAPMNLEGVTKYKLVSIDKQGAGRIAVLDVTIDGKLVSVIEIPSPNGNVRLNLDFEMNGGGHTLNNLDKGIVKSSESSATMDGAIRMGQTGEQPLNLNMKMQGTIKSSVTTEE